MSNILMMYSLKGELFHVLTECVHIKQNYCLWYVDYNENNRSVLSILYNECQTFESTVKVKHI